MTSTTAPVARPRGPLGALLDLFSSVWFGVWLLAILFVYSWVGSAGVPFYVGGNPFVIQSWVFEQIRQWPGLEMTEFEWFHWWPFDLMIALICANITVTTIRRIPLNTINLGVWLIHTGILILSLGSWIYFSTKVEGDSPVARRQLVVSTPDGATTTLPAIPGNRTSLPTSMGMYDLLVQDCDPAWTLLSGPNEGELAYAVQVMVTAPDGERFMRMLIAGEPEATQDSVFTDAGPGEAPLQRAIKAIGRPLVDEQLSIEMEYLPQDWFYLANWVQKSWALYVREQGTSDWSMRPIEGMPLYNDYVGSLEEVWVPDGASPQVGGLAVDVPAVEPGDPLGDLPLRITSYLRYAFEDTRWVEGGRLNPTAEVRLEDGFGEVFDHDLVAFDPGRDTASRNFLALRWVEDEADRARVATPSAAYLHLSIPGTDIHMEHVVGEVSARNPDLAWTDVGDSGYAFRIQFVEQMGDPSLPEAIASVELKKGDRRWRRFVAEDERFIQDVDAGDDGLVPTERYPLDTGISIDFHPPVSAAAVTVVAGPRDDDLGIVLNVGSPQDGEWTPVVVGEAFSLGRGDTVTVRRYTARSEEQKRPWIVPPSRRNRDAREANSKVRVAYTAGGRTEHVWVGFHQYPIRDRRESFRRYWYDPAEITVDGRTYELMLSRQRLPLPDPVILEDFTVASHVGGFTGRVSSILNWTSQVRFGDGAGWTEDKQVSVNDPVEHEGLWFFQAQWDPPSGPRGRGDVPSKGLNYTVLGVGNRQGVGVQLLGCCVSVLGMLYAFYVKPILIKRRRKGAAKDAAA